MMKTLMVIAALAMASAATWAMVTRPSDKTAPSDQTAPTELKVGDRAPDFALVGSDGKTWRLRDLKGKAVVVAWFPKAFTGG